MLLVVATLFLYSICNSTQPLMPISVKVTDTTLYNKIASQTKVGELISIWSNKELINLHATSWPMIDDYSMGHYHRDTIVSLSFKYSLPLNYSSRNVSYTLVMTYQFRDSICINENELYDFCKAIPSLINNIESTKNSVLFLENSKPNNGFITCCVNSIEWFGKRDTLKASYKSETECHYQSFTFNDSILLDSLSLYLGKWKSPQIQQFQENIKIRYAKRTSQRIRVSSGSSCSGNNEYFIGLVGLGTIGSFRLSNSKNWSTFKEYIFAQSAAKQFLRSLNRSNCELNKPFESGYTFLPQFPDRFCNACGNTIFVEVYCPNSQENQTIYVKLIDYYKVGKVGFVDSVMHK